MTSRSEWRRRWAVIAGVVTALAVAGCDRGGGSAAPSASAAAVDLSPVPAPAGLIAEVHAPKPDDLWARARELIGGPALLMPSTFPLLVGTLLGLPPTAAVDVDGAIAAHAALVDLEGEIAWVAGVHVRSGAELVAKLSLGADARYDARADTASGVQVLVPRPGRAATGFALGVVGNYLLAGPSERALVHAGPFVARTLPRAPARSESLVALLREPALRGVVAPAVRREWQARRGALDTLARGQQAAKGAPDFAEPAAALAAAGELAADAAAWLESTTEVAIALEPRAEYAEVRVVATPAASGAAHDAVQAMVVGDTAPLLRLPAASALAVLWRSRPDAADASAWITRLRRLFGERLSEQDAATLEPLLRPWFGARGDHAAWALLADEQAPGLVGVVATTDSAAASAAFRGVPRVAAVRALASPLERWAGLRRVRHATLNGAPPLGRFERVTVTLGAPPGATPPASGPKERSYELGWVAAKPEEGYAALGPVVEPLLRAVHGAASGASPALGADSPARAVLGRVGHPVVLALFVRPARVGLGTSDAPSLITLGRSAEGAAVLRIEVARETLGVAARLALRR
ncbi:MAG: hypothetical protein IT376_03330 [Polyangiaceae bacterium]|nr:hypothetical protein [Polyangiaceae bacterium]